MTYIKRLQYLLSFRCISLLQQLKCTQICSNISCAIQEIMINRQLYKLILFVIQMASVMNYI